MEASMFDNETPRPPAPRPRPVVYYGAFTAALGAFLGFAGLVDLMPKTVIAWIALLGAVVTAAGAVLVQNTVTPLSSPQDARGEPLIPTDVAEAEKAQAVAEAARPEPAGPRTYDLGSTQPGHPFPRD
jgi:hypothetical protein